MSDNTGVISLNTIPFFGKSGTSLILLAISLIFFRRHSLLIAYFSEHLSPGDYLFLSNDLVNKVKDVIKSCLIARP